MNETAAPPDKFASVLARRIENKIISLGWPVGEVLGSEATLIERYGVSRGVMREAIRLLEHKQVATMRSGPNGGLIVGAPAASAIAETVSNYFTFASVDIVDVFVTRRHIESACLRLAADRMSEGGIARLRTAAESSDPADLHRSIADLTRNPALLIIVDSLLQASLVPAVRDRGDAFAVRAQHQIAEALFAGRLGRAEQLLINRIDHQESSTDRTDLDAAVTANDQRKLPEQIAFQVVRDVHGAGYEVGEIIGSEQEFADRYGVSRAVFRQTIRILEYYEILHMRPGHGGGVAVGEGDPHRVVDAATTYLDFMQIDPRHLSEARRVLEMAALSLAMSHLTTDDRQRLADEIQAECSVNVASVYRHGPDFHLLIADLSRNAAIFFFVKVLTQLQTSRIRAYTRDADDDTVIGRRIVEAHQRVVDAMLDGDVALARLRMGRHLGAMVERIESRRVIPAGET